METGIRLVAEDATGRHADLLAAGVEVGELLRWEGVPPMSVLRDPDGNRLEVIE